MHCAVPELAFITPSQKTVGGKAVGPREQLRDQALQEAKKHKGKTAVSAPKLAALAKDVKDKKREASQRATPVKFADGKAVENEHVARLLVAASRALKKVYIPAMLAHATDSSSGGDTQTRGGEKKKYVIDTLVDSATTHCMCDSLEAKLAGISVDTSQQNQFKCASGPGFSTIGTTKEQLPYELKEVDGSSTMVMKTESEVAEMGGKHGQDKARNLVSVAPFLVFGCKMDVLFCADELEDGSTVWAACIIDRKKGTMSRINLTEDMLPALDRVGGRPMQYRSQPMTLERLADRYAKAGAARRERLGLKSTHHTRGSRVDDADDEEETEYETPDESVAQSPLDQWMDSGWSHQALASKGKKARTAKENIVYNKKAVHGLLHRPAEETRQALNHPSVTYEDDNGNRKKGTELTVEDCSFGNCSVCKQTRPVAPTKRSGTTKHTYMCVDCLDKDTHLVYAARRD